MIVFDICQYIVIYAFINKYKNKKLMNLENELTKEKLVRVYAGIGVYNIHKSSAPMTYAEIVKISNDGFDVKDAGDEFDNTYTYLVAYHLTYREIVGIYRYVICKTAIDGNNVFLSTSNYYKFTPIFIKNVLYKSIELGRSVNNKNSRAEKENPGIGITVMWRCGLGPLIQNYYLQYEERNEIPPITNLFGQFSLQRANYDVYSKNGAIALMSIFAMFIKNFGVSNLKHRVLVPQNDLILPDKLSLLDYLHLFSGNYSKDQKLLKFFLRDLNMPEPKLAFHYGNLDKNNEEHVHVYWPVFNELLDSFEMGLSWDISSISEAYKRMFIGDPSDINLSAFDPI